MNFNFGELLQNLSNEFNGTVRNLCNEPGELSGCRSEGIGSSPTQPALQWIPGDGAAGV
jgi:hypothetical protein